MKLQTQVQEAQHQQRGLEAVVVVLLECRDRLLRQSLEQALADPLMKSKPKH